MWKSIVKKYKKNSSDTFLIFWILFIMAILSRVVFVFQGEISKFVKNNTTFISYLGILGALATLFFTAYQSIIARRQHLKSHERDCSMKAIDLSRDYKILLDGEISYVIAAMHSLGITNIIRKYDNNLFSAFDNDELKNLITEEDRKEIDDKLNNLDPNKLIVVYCQYSKNYDQMVNSKYKKFNNIDKSRIPNPQDIEDKIKDGVDNLTKVELFALKNAILDGIEFSNLGKEAFKEEMMLTSDFYNKLDSCMNSLEWFAMHFKNCVADEEVVYQSLHQSYINIVSLLYYSISSINTIPHEKYFINIIWLYNLWCSKMNSKKIELDQYKKSLICEKEPLRA